MSDPNQNDIPRIGPKSLAQERRVPPVPTDYDEPEEHNDERWLVSYADMMTLLFGLFVLLFSMSTLDPQVAAQIHASTQNSFKSDATPEAPAAPPVDTTALQQQLTEMQNQVRDLQAQLNQRTAELAELTAASQTETVDQTIDVEQMRRDLASKDIRVQELEQELKKRQRTETASPNRNKEAELEAQVARLKDQLDKSTKEARLLMNELTDSKLKGVKTGDAAKMLRETQEKLEKAKIDNEKIIELARKVSAENKTLKAEAERKVASVATAATMQTENEKLKTDLDKLKQDIAKEKMTSEQLKKEVESMNGGKGQDFMAFFINWPTKDHDVDLTIQDPSGKTFDFKRREYKGQPGLFALDTRRGPGVELWQSKNIVPGRYKATYQLYNDYGNAEAAPVSAVILTPRGSFELPIAKLSTSGTRRVSAEFEVDKAGGVKILKGK
ncbi:MAG: hypothetical protein KF767_17475 [Bdellovibrionaceae bacterium]|nr:hypothetical protein [Pseudobdellovibrionaceae bacterium]